MMQIDFVPSPPLRITTLAEASFSGASVSALSDVQVQPSMSVPTATTAAALKRANDAMVARASLKGERRTGRSGAWLPAALRVEIMPAQVGAIYGR